MKNKLGSFMMAMRSIIKKKRQAESKRKKRKGQREKEQAKSRVREVD